MRRCQNSFLNLLGFNLSIPHFNQAKAAYSNRTPSFMELTMRTLVYVLVMSLFVSVPLLSQSTREVSVLLNATVEKDPTPSITLDWRNEERAVYYIISRKLRAEVNFLRLDSVNGDINSWVDTNVEPGVMYEYAVTSAVQVDTLLVNRFGYIASGIELSACHDRGNVLLLIDSTMLDPLSSEIERLQMTL